MENDTLIEKDIISMRSSALNPQHQFALQFEPGTSVQHMREWVSHYVQQAQKKQAGMGKRTAIALDSMRVQSDGLVILNGANIGEIAQLTEVKASVIAAHTGTEVMQGEIQPKPKGPPPRIPADSVLSKVKGVGQTLNLKIR